MKKYLKLLRVKHYLKNVLIFLPLFFSGNLLNLEMSIKSLIGFINFSVLASSIYIFNDIIDIEQDRRHPTKKYRPIAYGEISKFRAINIMIGLCAVVICIQILLFKFKTYNFNEFLYSSLILLTYFIINILYSKYLKNVAIIDVILLATCFVIRVFYGGVIISVDISGWLYLTVLSISLYMALGKRKGELKQNNKSTRTVLKYYSENFLDKYMYVFLTSSIIFYSLWCTMSLINLNKYTYLLMFSVIFVIFIIMRYSLDVEEEGSGDPIDVIYGDKILFISVLIYVIYMGGIIYV